MPYNDVEQLRKSGKLDEAYQQAQHHLQQRQLKTPTPDIKEETIETDTDTLQQPETMLTRSKRAMAWVLHDLLKQHTTAADLDVFTDYLQQFVALELDEDEKMVTNQLVWPIGTAAFEFTKEPDFDVRKMEKLAVITMKLHFSRPGKGYSFIFKAFHKALRESALYLDFVEWWGITYFTRDDTKIVKSNDKMVRMAIAEQGCNRYAKHLLKALRAADDTEQAEKTKARMVRYLPVLEEMMKYNKFFRMLPYYKVRLLLALGHYEQVFSALTYYARSRAADFWVWELLAEAYNGNTEKQIACLSAALLCKVKLDKLVTIRENLTKLLIEAGFYDEAKTEVAMILKLCLQNKWEIPQSVTDWGDETWYRQAFVKDNNLSMYQSYRSGAEELIFEGIPQRKIVIEAVNHSKKILNFLASDHSRGFFKYEKFLTQVEVGDVFLVRMKETKIAGRYNVFNIRRLREKTIPGIMQTFSGEVTIPEGKPYGFANSMYITPALCELYNLKHGEIVSGLAMISYNKKHEEWGWKIISID
jgi:hypothetical protein